jgi:hypothetical protein
MYFRERAEAFSETALRDSLDDEQLRSLTELLLDEGSTDDRGAGPQEHFCGRHLIADGLTPAARPRGSVDSLFGMNAFPPGHR